MRESAESRSAAVRAVLLRFYPHQYPWGDSSALTVSLLLTAATPDRDGHVRARGPPAGFEPHRTQTASRQAAERLSCRQGGGGQGKPRSNGLRVVATDDSPTLCSVLEFRAFPSIPNISQHFPAFPSIFQCISSALRMILRD